MDREPVESQHYGNSLGRLQSLVAGRHGPATPGNVEYLADAGPCLPTRRRSYLADCSASSIKRPKDSPSARASRAAAPRVTPRRPCSMR